MKDLRDKLKSALDVGPDLLPRAGEAAGIACSGGLDSMMLARLMVPLLTAQGSSCFLAWLDHGWRPDDAPRECAFVRDLADELGVGFYRAQRRPSGTRVRAIGREAAAREQRRSWLDYLARREEASRLYLGHHRDDQLETILLRRAEGVPAQRAASMAKRNGVFTRPLLGFTKIELEDCARRQAWHWLEDVSNRDLSLQRNRVRSELRGQSVDQNWVEQTLGEGDRARAYLDELQQRVDGVLNRVLIHGREGESDLRVKSDHICRLDEDVAILTLQRLCVAEHSCSRVPQRAALRPLIYAMSRSGRSRIFHLGAGWTARLSDGVLELRRGQRLEQEGGMVGLQAALPPGQEVQWPSFGTVQFSEVTAADALRMLRDSSDAGARFAVFDLEELVGPLHVRATGIGLRITPYGSGGTRKVRDVLADAGIPRYQRANWPVVLDANGRVLWLPGVRSAAYAPLSGTSRAAALLYTTASPAQGRASIALKDRVS